MDLVDRNRFEAWATTAPRAPRANAPKKGRVGPRRPKGTQHEPWPSPPRRTSILSRVYDTRLIDFGLAKFIGPGERTRDADKKRPTDEPAPENPPKGHDRPKKTPLGGQRRDGQPGRVPFTAKSG